LEVNNYIIVEKLITDVLGFEIVGGSHPHRSKMQPMPKSLVLQGFFGFLGQFF
jgi:hypothetical protein